MKDRPRLVDILVMMVIFGTIVVLQRNAYEGRLERQAFRYSEMCGRPMK